MLHAGGDIPQVYIVELPTYLPTHHPCLVKEEDKEPGRGVEGVVCGSDRVQRQKDKRRGGKQADRGLAHVIDFQSSQSTTPPLHHSTDTTTTRSSNSHCSGNLILGT